MYDILLELRLLIIFVAEIIFLKRLSKNSSTGHITMERAILVLAYCSTLFNLPLYREFLVLFRGGWDYMYYLMTGATGAPGRMIDYNVGLLIEAVYLVLLGEIFIMLSKLTGMIEQRQVRDKPRENRWYIM